MGAAGGEETAGKGVGDVGTTFVGVCIFSVTYLTEDPVDCLGIVFSPELYEMSVDAYIRVSGVFEADGVALLVGEDCVTFFSWGFVEVVEATGFTHLVGGEGVGEEVGDVDGIDVAFCLGE